MSSRPSPLKSATNICSTQKHATVFTTSVSSGGRVSDGPAPSPLERPATVSVVLLWSNGKPFHIKASVFPSRLRLPASGQSPSGNVTDFAVKGAPDALPYQRYDAVGGNIRPSQSTSSRPSPLKSPTAGP